MSLLDSPAAEGRVVLNADWQRYEKALDVVAGSSVRVTYDRGTLELMSPSPEHEGIKALLGSLPEAWMTHSGTDYVAGGSTTFRRQDLEKGLEPDVCFWTRRAAQVVGRTDIDVAVFPPDLAIEVDVSRSSIDRLAVYHALGIPEVWRYQDGTIEVFHRDTHGYVQGDASMVLPGLDPHVFEAYLKQRRHATTAAILRSFRSSLE